MAARFSQISRCVSGCAGAKSLHGMRLSAGNGSSGRGAGKCESLWRDLFSQPTQWWDNRAEKPSSRFPDFTHKQTGEALWLHDRRTPAWVASDVDSVAPGVSIFSSSRRLSKFNKAGQFGKTLELFQQMEQEGMRIDEQVFVQVLNACAGKQLLQKGRLVHRQIIEAGCDMNLYVSSSLVDMYAKCGSIEEALSVFEKMPTRNVVTWNAIILGCVKCKQGHKALELCQDMQVKGVMPNSVTFVGMLNACASTGALKEGKRIHNRIIQSGCGSNVYVENSLVDMYAKCGSIDDARRVFDKMSRHTAVSWNAMISGCVKCREGQEALDVFHKMQREGVDPDSVTFVGVLNACASIGAFEEGRLVHEQIAQRGCESNVYILNSLVDMYAKCGSIEDAWRVFHKMPVRGVIAWSAMILGYVKSGQGQKALELFTQMQHEGVDPDSVTFVGLLNACASIPALEEGKRVHYWAIRSGHESHPHVRSSLVDMYAKCGSIDDARRAFDKMSPQDVVAWNAMIHGYVKCGQGPRALELFQQLQLEGIKANSITYVGALNACASVAALENGKHVHRQIIESGFESDLFVSTCLVDMYAKCGNLDDARRLFDKMHRHDAAAWTAMMMGYAMHGLADEAVTLFEQMFRAGSKINEVTFVCLLTACSHGGLVEEGIQYFNSMRSVYSVSPTLQHYTCMVDLLGRAGRLDDAEKLVKTIPFEPSAAPWISLLGACKIHGNVDMGEYASKQILEVEPKSSSGYVLLSNIYAATGH